MSSDQNKLVPFLRHQWNGYFGKEGKRKKNLDAMEQEGGTFLWQFKLERKHCLFRSSICRDAVS